MNLFKRYWPFIFLAAVFLLLFYKVFFLGQVLYDGDNFHLNIPEKYFFVQQVLQEHVPLWNPYLFLGIPYLADFNLGTLNPANILYFLFPVARALTLLTIIDLFGISVGMYLLLRSYAITKTASLFGGIVMSLSGMPFVLLGNMTFLQVIVYIPFIFLLVRKFCQTKNLKWLFILISVQFLQFIAGHPQETYYTMLFISSYLLFVSQFTLKKKVAIILFYIVIPVLLSSMQLLPFLEYVQHANRPVGSIAYAGWGGQRLSTVVSFLLPTFYGSHVDGTWWGTQQILVGFIGIPTLVLLYIGIGFAKFKEKWFFTFGLVASFLLAFGKLTPLFYFFYYLVPGWKLFRAPSGILVFYTFFAAMLAAFGLEYVNKNSLKFKKIGIWIFLIGLVFSIFSGAMYIIANKATFWEHALLLLQQHLHKHFLDALLFYDANKLQQMFQGILWNIIFVSIFLCLTGFILAFFSKKNFQTALILILTTIGFFIVNPKVMLLAPLSFYDAGKIVPSVLTSVKDGEYRMLAAPVDLHQHREHLPAADFFYEEGQANLSIYQFDNNIERGLYQVGGYTSLVPGSFSKFIDATDAESNVTNINFADVTQKQLNLASVGYITSHEPITSFNNISLQLVEQKPGNRYVYKNVQALPRVYILEDPYGKHILWQKEEPTNLTFSVSVDKSSHLILTDWYYPGWKSFVNGKEVQIQPYLKTFREIAVPKGMSSVQFVYDPLSFKIGIIISSITLFALLVSFTLFKNKKI